MTSTNYLLRLLHIYMNKIKREILSFENDMYYLSRETCFELFSYGQTTAVHMCEKQLVK